MERIVDVLPRKLQLFKHTYWAQRLAADRGPTLKNRVAMKEQFKLTRWVGSFPTEVLAYHNLLDHAETYRDSHGNMVLFVSPYAEGVRDQKLDPLYYAGFRKCMKIYAPEAVTLWYRAENAWAMRRWIKEHPELFPEGA